MAIKRRRALTTGQIAEYMSVRPATVFNWIRAGKLKAYTTPGGHYRVRLEDFRHFLEEQKVPIDETILVPQLGRILIVGDDPQTMEMIQNALEKEDPDYRFATASDGYSAGLQVASFQPDLVILDLSSGKMDGFEVCRRIKHDPKTRGTRVLAVTASNEENIQKARETGADDIIMKPINIDDLRRKERTLLRPR